MLGDAALTVGGCCANVWLLERVVRLQPHCDDVTTFAQFVFVALVGLIAHKGHVPEYKSWIVPALLFWSSSVLNNKVWAFNVSVQVHTVFRSLGTLVALLFGSMIAGREYSVKQVIGVVIITLGALFATFDLQNSGETSWKGLGVLSLSLLLTGFQSVVYERQPKNWHDSVFMTHFLPLPFFLFMSREIKSEWTNHPGTWLLLLNAMTQYICILGVNKLAMHGAVTMNVVLTMRKMITLILSMWLYGWDVRVGVGAAIVAVGTFIYGMGTSTKKTET